MTATTSAPERLAREPAEDPVVAQRPDVGFRQAAELLLPYRMPLSLALVIGIAAAVASALQPLVVSRIVDTFTRGIGVRDVASLAALLVGGALLTAVRELVIERTGERYALDTRARLVAHLHALPISTLDARDRGDLVTRVTNDVSETRNFLTSGLVDLAVSIVTVLISLVMMALIDPVLLGLAAVAVVVVFLVVVALGRRTRPAGLQMQTSLGALAESVSRSLGSMRTVRANRAVAREQERTLAHALEVRRAGMRAAGLRAVLQTVAAVSVQVLLIVVVGLGALRVSAGVLTTGELSAFIMYLMLLVTPIAMVGNVLASLGEAFGSLARIRELEAEVPEPDVQDPGASREGGPADPVLRFDSVRFGYPRGPGDPGAGDLALDDVSFSVRAQETVAFVGPSGAGKSTIFLLLERFYEPDGGRILFEGRDVAGLSREGLRRRLAYVDQDAAVLAGNVRDNLALARPDVTDDECVDALTRVGLVPTRDAGRRYLEQEVGDLGTRLSGGQRQRLAIARAWIAGSTVLLLDEATSHLDSRNEALVQVLLEGAQTRRTTLVIAHRLSTVVAADRIIVLDKGRIVAQGTHTELLRGCPLYEELATHQLLTRTTEG